MPVMLIVRMIVTSVSEPRRDLRMDSNCVRMTTLIVV